MTVFRMCAVCRERKPKSELLRITKDKSGHIGIDKDGKLPGRGMYLCKDENCIKCAQKRKVIERSFSKSDSDIYGELLRLWENGDIN